MDILPRRQLITSSMDCIICCLYYIWQFAELENLSHYQAACNHNMWSYYYKRNNSQFFYLITTVVYLMKYEHTEKKSTRGIDIPLISSQRIVPWLWTQLRGFHFSNVAPGVTLVISRLNKQESYWDLRFCCKISVFWITVVIWTQNVEDMMSISLSLAVCSVKIIAYLCRADLISRDLGSTICPPALGYFLIQCQHTQSTNWHAREFCICIILSSTFG
jgi:hypothetical protein